VGAGERSVITESLAALEQALRGSGVRIVSKADAWHQRVIGRALWLVTLGGQASYLSRYVTTIGRTIYVTPDWHARSAVDRYLTLRHEAVHVAQFRRYRLLPMAVAYLLLPLPFGLSWCRMRLERQAYEETVRAAFELGGRPLAESMRAQIIDQFTSAAYGWMWPFPRALARWYDSLLDRLS
jgi:hypothetical protein